MRECSVLGSTVTSAADLLRAVRRRQEDSAVDHLECTDRFTIYPEKHSVGGCGVSIEYR